MTPEQYTAAISAHAECAVGTSLYSGEIYENLAQYLRRISIHAPDPGLDAEVLCFYAGGKKTAKHIKHMSELPHLQSSVNALLNDDARTYKDEAKSILIFLRGHQPAECLSYIGATCNVHPLFFQQHLEYRSSVGLRKLFANPPLPSIAQSIVRLKLITLGARTGISQSKKQSVIDLLRASDQAAMERYLHSVHLEQGLSAGDSIVRAFHTLDGQYFGIEQEITVRVESMSGKWLTIAWTDAARDLGSGPPWPWRSANSQSQKSTILPTVQHVPLDIPFPWPSMTRETVEDRKRVGQIAPLLSQNYGQTLDEELIGLDSFYALTELFRFSASSLCQFLNAIEETIERDTGYNLYKSGQYSLSNLLYSSDILDKLSDRLRDNIKTIQCRHEPLWPRALTSQDQKIRANLAADALLQDFKDLLDRAVHLHARCREGVAICMNSAAIAESKRAIEQAHRIGQLTRLAFLYIPLSFTTSFFGMNLRSVASGDLPLWLWFAVSIPVVVVSYSVLALMNGSQFGSNIEKCWKLGVSLWSHSVSS